MAKTMTVNDASRAYGNLEADICDAVRLVKVIYELFMAKIAEVEINVTNDEHDYMMETLLDRLRDLTGEIKRDFYKAAKTVSEGRDK
jgi:hypothetical protein